MEQTLTSLNISASSYQKFKSAEEWAEARRVPETRTALDLLESDTIAGTIYTFNPCLDEILEGEFIAGNILELCGEAGSGKTQICFQLCINVQLPELCGGKGGEAVYICTNYNFSSSRLKEISAYILAKISLIPQADAKLEHLNTDKLLSGIHYFKITTCEELFAAVIHLRNSSQIRLVVIDSIAAILDQVDYRNRRRVIYDLFADLQVLGRKHDFSIVVTNNMTTKIKSSQDVCVAASFGDSFFHRVNTRIYLKRKLGSTYEATVLKSTNGKPEIKKCFQL